MEAMTAALDELVDLLDLEALEVDLFRGFSPPEERHPGVRRARWRRRP